MSIADKLTTVAANQQKVYDAGYVAGQAVGGGDSHYDTFWDAYQDGGGRADYQHAFAGLGWNDVTFNPKYSLEKADTCNYMFARSGVIDLSNMTTINMKYGCSYVFWQAKSLTHIGVIRIGTANQKATSLCQDASALHTFDKLIIADGIEWTNAFHGCTSLVNITFEGSIGKSINFKDSPLSRESIEGVVGALSDDVTGQTATFNKAAVDKAFETEEGALDGSTNEMSVWFALVEWKGNWTVKCV